MKVAALNGLTAARGSILDLVDSESRIPKDDRVRRNLAVHLCRIKMQMSHQN